MKNTTKTLLAASALAGLTFISAQAATVTYVSGTSWDVAIWDTGSAPVNGDSVVANASTVLNYAFTVENGQSITTNGNWLALANDGWSNGPGNLTLASGGTINNVGALSARGNGWTVGPTFTIEDGASLTTASAAGNRDFNTVWETGASSVTTWNTTTFNLDLHHLTVDLTSYTAGTGSLTLASYTTLSGAAFASVNVFDGTGALTAGVDYTLDYTTGSNITLNVIPEPGTYALIGGLLALGYVMLRRR